MMTSRDQCVIVLPNHGVLSAGLSVTSATLIAVQGCSTLIASGLTHMRLTIFTAPIGHVTLHSGVMDVLFA